MNPFARISSHITKQFTNNNWTEVYRRISPKPDPETGLKYSIKRYHKYNFTTKLTTYCELKYLYKELNNDMVIYMELVETNIPIDEIPVALNVDYVLFNDELIIYNGE